ncbi:hypothetical protein HDU76_003721 [Blyttiomyces sp. JEL0837]|nr:hypothetical protein HDU76_003721 [Blyttiomyces sp. JEL0837]
MIPVYMNSIVPSIVQAVQAVLLAGFPNSTDPVTLNTNLNHYSELAAVVFLSTGLKPISSTLLGIDPTVFPLPEPAASANFSMSILTDLKEEQMVSFGLFGLTSAAQAKSLLTNTTYFLPWNSTLALADKKIFPDFSRCVVNDSYAYLKANFGVEDSINDSVLGYAVLFFLGHAIMTFIGLSYSRTFKKR